MRVECLPVFPERDLVNALHRSRQDRIQVAPEPFEHVRDFPADTKHVVPVNLPRISGSAIPGRITVESLPGLFLPGEEMTLDAVQYPASEPGRRHVATRNQAHVRGEDRPSPVMDRPIGQKSFDTPCEARKDSAQPLECVSAGALGRQIARAGRQRAGDRVIDDKPPVDHVRKPVAQTLFSKLGKQQPHVVVCARKAATDVERPVERFIHQARHLRFVGHLETGIEIRLERELAEERQAERVDGADGDVA